MPTAFPTPAAEPYGVRARRNHAEAILAAKGYEQYLPSHKVRRRWPAAQSKTTFRFSGYVSPDYVFVVLIAASASLFVATPGVASTLGSASNPPRITEQEIAAAETLPRSGIAAEPHPLLREGQRIRRVEAPSKLSKAF